MRRSFKYRLYPNRSQSEVLDTMLESHRRLYNLALRDRRDVYEAEKRSVSYGEQSARFKETRKVLPRFAALNFSSAEATLRRLDKAFKAFFRHVKVKLHRSVEGTIKTVSVKRFCGKWYVIFSCDLGDAPEVTGDGPAVGIDLGLESFLVTSDGKSVESPRYYRESQKKLRKAQRSISRKKKGSNRRRKAQEKVARLHEKTANQRRDFHHKQARKLVDTHGLIVHEALNIKGIARTRLAKSTHDAGWASFLNILSYKAEEAGTRVVAVNPRNTTQACSSCGAMPEVKKTLSDRTHVCPCGYTDDRDLNAALNILSLGRSDQAQTYRDAERVA